MSRGVVLMDLMKQRLLVVLAAVLFVGVWSVVIIQLTSAQEKAKTGMAVSGLERMSIEKQKVDIAWGEDWDTRILKTDHQVNQTKEVGTRDLRTVSFSDIDTSDGVPIDIILKRLELK
ncbi:hypothetical protein [Alkalihalobacterium chitinilyticum]|uniref:Uncharacterized protein n=1 Tax=Alkalihalobacterium chitinilyticum TaxID=2980103 RepID=A0ABT5V8T1_9BACI|nr:hypothetical protein [Alkalihalobacterium chitinilyticum]MDE5411845.1 hypothetical protein [Alkalihalobacterium chitinilyticum]